MTERMSNLDAAWLHMEDPTNLMMIVGLMWFERPVDWAAIRGLIQQRLVARYPRFRQRVMEHTLASPRWEDDPRFDVEAHLHHVALPAPGDQPTLEALVSDLMSTPLDFSKPLWQIHLVDGFGAGGAILYRIHHCIGDGISLARVLLSLADGAGDVGVSGPREHGFHPLAAARRGLERVRHTADALTDPKRLAALAREGVEGAEELAELLALPADPASAIKGPLGVRKRAVWAAPTPLAEVKRACKARGCTLNDGLIAAMTGALRRYLLGRGQEVAALRAFVPVNMRPLDEPVPTTLGNRFTLVLLELPVGEADPEARLALLKARMDHLKGGAQASVNYGLLHALGATPARVERVVADIFGSKASAVMTNVPGPRERLTFAGNPVAGIQFWVPQAAHLGLGVSIFSYAGEVTVGVAADVGLVPDPEALVAAFEAELADFIAA